MSSHRGGSTTSPSRRTSTTWWRAVIVLLRRVVLVWRRSSAVVHVIVGLIVSLVIPISVTIIVGGVAIFVLVLIVLLRRRFIVLLLTSRTSRPGWPRRILRPLLRSRSSRAGIWPSLCFVVPVVCHCVGVFLFLRAKARCEIVEVRWYRSYRSSKTRTRVLRDTLFGWCRCLQHRLLLWLLPHNSDAEFRKELLLQRHQLYEQKCSEVGVNRVALRSHPVIDGA